MLPLMLPLTLPLFTPLSPSHLHPLPSLSPSLMSRSRLLLLLPLALVFVALLSLTSYLPHTRHAPLHHTTHVQHDVVRGTHAPKDTRPPHTSHDVQSNSASHATPSNTLLIAAQPSHRATRTRARVETSSHPIEITSTAYAVAIMVRQAERHMYVCITWCLALTCNCMSGCMSLLSHVHIYILTCCTALSRHPR